MPQTTSVWPQNAPTLDVTNNQLTVYRFLRNSPLVEKVLTNYLKQRLWADKVFAAGPRTASGSVMYSQLTTEGSYYTSRDVQSIAPATEFPNVGMDEETLLVATVAKWGGRVSFPYETVDRDARDLLTKGLLRLSNTIARKVDTQAIAALNAAPVLTAAASGDWSTSTTDILGDIQTAQSAIMNLDMGYEADTVLINPAQALDVRKSAAVRLAMPRETTNDNFLWGRSRDLDGIAGLNYFITNRVTAGEVWVLQRQMAGSISDERPFYTRTIDKQETEEWIVQAARMFVPYVTDPKCVFKITGA